MFLDSPSQTLGVPSRAKHGDGFFMVYARSGLLKCFKSGDVGHKGVAVPHKRREEAGNSPVAHTTDSGAVDAAMLGTVVAAVPRWRWTLCAAALGSAAVSEPKDGSVATNLEAEHGDGSTPADGSREA